MSRHLLKLHRALQLFERQAWPFQAVVRNVTSDLQVAQQAGTSAALGSTLGPCTPLFRDVRMSSGNWLGAWEIFGVKHQDQRAIQGLRQFTSSSSRRVAAEEGGAAAKKGEKVSEIPKAAATGEAAGTSGQQTEAATMAMRKGRMSGPVSWGSLALLLITGGGLLIFYDREKRRKLESVRQGPSVGKAAIGGAFELVNQDGKKVTDKNFKGNWNLVYFGFTFCPDICPDELKKMAEAIDKVEKKIGVPVVPIFISVDPERDNVEQVGRYVKEFHPRLVGLTGSVEAVKQAAKAYRVYYMKTEDEGDDYLVDHSIIQYLMDPQMEFVKFFGKNHTADSLAEGIAGEIKSATA